MKINVGYDRPEHHNMSNTPIAERFKSAPKWIEHASDTVEHDTVNNYILKDEKFVYCLGTLGGAKWYLKHKDDERNTILFDNFSLPLIKHAQQGKVLIHIDQSLEGFPLLETKTPYHHPRIVDHFKIIHENLEHYKINPKNLVFSTSNLIEQDNYDRWCKTNNVQNKFTIISLPFFACATQQSGFFDWVDKPDTRDDPHDVIYQTQLNYKSTYPVQLFNCLNRVQRTHRSSFIAMLNYYGLIENNIVSHDKFLDYYSHSLLNKNWPEHPAFVDPNFTDIKSKLPLIFDMKDFNVNHAQNFNKKIYKKTWISVITETLYEDWAPTIFFSEKVFKPMRAHHPFILVCHTQGIEFLKKIGFKTFDTWWDESYDSEIDPVLRMEKICSILLKLQKLDHTEWFSLYNDMEKVLQHNYNHLITTNWFQDAFRKVLSKFYEI